MKTSSETGSSKTDLMLIGIRALHLSFLQGKNSVLGGPSRLLFTPHCSELDNVSTAKPLSDKGLGRKE